MPRKSKNWILFRVVNILVPLLAGMVLYTILTDDTYVSQWIRRTFAQENSSVLSTRAGFLRFCRNHLCDMCWSYSLVFCIAWILGQGRVWLTVSVSVCALFSTLMELVQLSAAFPGTFDVWDILLEIVSCLIAGMVIYTNIRRKRK